MPHHPLLFAPRTNGLAPFVLCFVGLLGCSRAEQAPANPAAQTMPAGKVAAGQEPTNAPAGTGWTLAPHEPGNLRLRYRGANMAELRYRILLQDGRKPPLEPISDGPGQFHLRFSKQEPNRLMGRTSHEADALHIDYRTPHDAGNESVSVTGRVQLLFDFNLTTLYGAAGYPQPEALPDKRGFRLPLGTGSVLTVEFNKPVQAIEFEQTATLLVRLTLPSVATAAEASAPLRMTIRPPGHGQVREAMADRLGRPDPSFRTQIVDGMASPFDLRFLNASDRPAGSHGKLAQDGDALRFADGTPARFWGTNVVGYALFHSDNRTIERTARRLAAFGFNLVRIHHHDSRWVRPNVLASGNTTMELDEKALSRLDYWIHCLRQEGIYVWLDLEVGRSYRKGDNIPGYEEVAAQKGSGKSLNYVNERLMALMERFSEQYLNHRNPHTGLRYREDPALIGVLVSNENDLIKHGVVLAVQDKVPYHHQLFRRFAVAYAKAHNMPMPQALHAWEPGAPAIVMGALEQRFYRRHYAHLRKLGVTAPIAVGNYWGWSALDALPSLATGDVMDVHSYGHEGELLQNPRYGSNFLHWIAGAALTDKPVTVTEWNTALPARDRANHPLFIASTAALQGWDALMSYAYTQNPRWVQPDPYSIGHDPALMATMPQAALAYRRGDVATAKHHYRLQITRADLYQQNPKLRPIDLTALRTLLHQSRVTLDLPPVPELGYPGTPAPPDGHDATLVTDLSQSFMTDDQEVLHSDTNELTWHLGDEPVYTIDTKRTQSAAGFLGHRPLALSTLQIDLSTAVAAVALSSLDGLALERSQEMLLSVGAQAVPNDDPRRSPTAVFLSQPVAGQVGIRSTHPKLRLVPLSPTGIPQAALRGELRDGVFWFELPEAAPSPWFKVIVPRTRRPRR